MRKVADVTGKGLVHCDVIEGIIALCERLNLTVVAEGIETKSQKEFIQSLNCNLMQGCYLGTPENSQFYPQKTTIFINSS